MDMDNDGDANDDTIGLSTTVIIRNGTSAALIELRRVYETEADALRDAIGVLTSTQPVLRLVTYTDVTAKDTDDT